MYKALIMLVQVSGSISVKYNHEKLVVNDLNEVPELLRGINPWVSVKVNSGC